MQFWETFLT